MKLFLDATNNLKTIIKLDDRQFIKTYTSPRDQDIFAFLLQIIKEQSLDLKKISEIEVNPGPGSFTGSRLGVAIANALAFSLNIKVNGQQPPINPLYSQNTTWKENPR